MGPARRLLRKGGGSVKAAKLIELARALQREIRQTPEDGFADEQNNAIADMEWTLQRFIETVEGKCAVALPAAPVAVSDGRKVAA